MTGDLLDHVERRAARGLRKRDGTGEAFGGDHEPGVSCRNQPSEIDPHPLGYLARQEGGGYKPESPVEPAGNEADNYGERDGGEGSGDRAGDARKQFVYRRGHGQGVSRNEHDDHLKSKLKYGEDTAVPGRGDAGESGIGRKETRKHNTEKGEQHGEDIGVWHHLFKEENKH